MVTQLQDAVKMLPAGVRPSRSGHQELKILPSGNMILQGTEIPLFHS